MGKKIDKGKHVGRAGHMEQRKDQASQMRQQDDKREQRTSRGKPAGNKKSK